MRKSYQPLSCVANAERRGDNSIMIMALQLIATCVQRDEVGPEHENVLLSKTKRSLLALHWTALDLCLKNGKWRTSAPSKKLVTLLFWSAAEWGVSNCTGRWFKKALDDFPTTLCNKLRELWCHFLAYKEQHRGFSRRELLKPCRLKWPLWDNVLEDIQCLPGRCKALFPGWFHLSPVYPLSALWASALDKSQSRCSLWLWGCGFRGRRAGAAHFVLDWIATSWSRSLCWGMRSGRRWTEPAAPV